MWTSYFRKAKYKYFDKKYILVFFAKPKSTWSEYVQRDVDQFPPRELKFKEFKKFNANVFPAHNIDINVEHFVQQVSAQKGQAVVIRNDSNKNFGNIKTVLWRYYFQLPIHFFIGYENRHTGPIRKGNCTQQITHLWISSRCDSASNVRRCTPHLHALYIYYRWILIMEKSWSASKPVYLHACSWAALNRLQSCEDRGTHAALHLQPCL